MKCVSFEVAKALKKAGYPQESPLRFYVSGEYKDFTIGELYNAAIDYTPIEYRVNAPYVMEAWLWLWREKNIHIDINHCLNKCSMANVFLKYFEGSGPEEAIKKAIEYLVEHNLIK